MSSGENPFRPNGQLAQEADEIVSALKSGNLQNVAGNTTATNDLIIETTTTSVVDGGSSGNHANGGGGGGSSSILDTSNSPSSPSSPPLEKKPGGGSEGGTVLKVEHSVIVNSKTENVEHVIVKEGKKEKKCCHIL